jgi:hypothetical protein
MIAEIDNQRDITVFLTTDEVAQLSTETLEGVLIKSDKPKQQGIIFVSVNAERYNGSAVGVFEDKIDFYSYSTAGKFEIFIGPRYYENDLKTRGIIGVRYGSMGSKVHIYNYTLLGGMERINAENLEFYRDNKDKMPDSFG